MRTITWTPGDEIRKAREIAGMDQQALADQLGVSRPTISKWERGRTEPTISQWRAIMRATGVQLRMYLNAA